METTKRNYSLENPKEFHTSHTGTGDHRSTTTFSAFLSTPDLKDEANAVSPQKLFSRFSRFVVSILTGGKSVTANIPVETLPELVTRTAFMAEKAYEAELRLVQGDQESTPETDLSPAYTARFTMGPFKGKTPAQVYLENPTENSGKLQEQYAFLKQNVDKYPANKTLMDAIMDCARKATEGTLKAQESQAGGMFTIYAPGVRPNRRKKNENGLSPVYSMEVVYDMTPGKKYPIILTVRNFFAPVEEKAGGLLNVNYTGIDPATDMKHTVYMSVSEWNQIVSEMQDQKNAFICANAEKLLSEAERIYQQKRMESTRQVATPA